MHLNETSLPLHFFILDLLALPHEETSQSSHKLPSWGVLALNPAKYVVNQGPPGALRVQVGVELANLASTPEPLAGHKATMVRKYSQQALPFGSRPRSLAGAHTCPLNPGQEQAHAPVQPRVLPELSSALLDGAPK